MPKLYINKKILLFVTISILSQIQSVFAQEALNIDSLIEKKVPIPYALDLYGDTVFFYDKITLLNFSFFACGPCMREIPYFNLLYNEFDKNKVQIVTIVPHIASDILKYQNKSDSSSIFCFIREQFGYEKIEYKIIPECETKMFSSQRTIRIECNTISDEFLIDSYPTTLIVDHQGIIRYCSFGFNKFDISSLKKYINKLIALM